MTEAAKAPRAAEALQHKPAASAMVAASTAASTAAPTAPPRMRFRALLSGLLAGPSRAAELAMRYIGVDQFSHHTNLRRALTP